MADKVYLEPVLDSRKSFYGKAYVTRRGDFDVLTSYSTDVAVYNRISGEVDINGFYSNTTTRHIKDFLYQRGIINQAVSSKFLWENFTKSGREEVIRRNKEKEDRAREREAVRLRKAEEKRIEKETAKAIREERKTQLLLELTSELGDTLSKSEIRKLMYQELREESLLTK